MEPPEPEENSGWRIASLEEMLELAEIATVIETRIVRRGPERTGGRKRERGAA